MKQKKKFSYAEQSQRLRVKKVSKDEDLFGKLCEIFGSDTTQLRQALAEQSSSSQPKAEVSDSDPSDGIWKAVPANVTPEHDHVDKMDELPYSTESCVVEVPTAVIAESALVCDENETKWDLDSAFAEAESLALKSEMPREGIVSESSHLVRRKVIEDMKRTLFELHNYPSSQGGSPALSVSTSRKSSVHTIERSYENIRKLSFESGSSEPSVQMHDSKPVCRKGSVTSSLKVDSDEELMKARKLSSGCAQQGAKRKVSICLSNTEVKSLQDELALELKKAVEDFAKKRNANIVKDESTPIPEIQQTIATVDDGRLAKSAYHPTYFVRENWDESRIFSRGGSQRSSSNSVELPLALMLSKPKAKDSVSVTRSTLSETKSVSDTKSNFYDSVYEGSVTEYEPESPTDSLEHFDFEDKAERESVSSSTDSGVPSSGGCKDDVSSPVPEESRRSLPCPLTFYKNPALEPEPSSVSPNLSEGTINSGFEADRACDEDTEETYKQIVIDVADEGEKRIRFAPTIETSPEPEVRNDRKRSHIIALALSAVRIWAQLKAYLANNKSESDNSGIETDVEEPVDLNAKVAKPVPTGVRRISSDLHIKYVQLARDHSWLPKARIHQETSDWLQDVPKGLNSFEELRKYVKDGGDMAKEIATILHERSELEASYAKGLSKLAAKLMKTARESSGTIPAAWQAVGSEMETEAELHKTLAVSLSEDLVKPVRCVIENHHRSRKAVEVSVDKTARCLAEWRAAQAKAKKQCYMCARDNEKMQDVGFSESRHGRSRTLSEKETAKLDGKRRKSEEALRKADVEYYAYCVRAERARLDWDAATCRGSQCFQAIEEERLTQLRDLAAKYHSVVKDMGPKLVQSADRLSLPIMRCNIDSDLQTVVALRSAGSNASEQLLPDFYSEHMSNIMNRERRRESLEKCLHLICSDIERERRAKAGVENLARALQETPNFGSQESQQDVSDKLKHLKAMLAFLEATKVKVTNALADLENRPKAEHPLVKYLEVHKDKQGLIQSVLKLPSWAHELDSEGETPTGSNSPDFPDGGIGDEASVQPDSDFDEFSSQESDSEDYPHSAVQSIPSHSIHSSPVLETSRTPGTPGAAGRCRALYTYTANMYDELTINPGDIINIHDKQEDGWWVGEHDGNIGIFPATYVEEIE